MIEVIKKVCFKCNIKKSLTNYYKHKEMADGHLNKCKTCTKKDTKKRTEIITSTPEGLEKERARQREKYKRLGYKEKQKVWDKNKHWKNTSKYKGLSKKFESLKGYELHHWCYKNEYLEDVILMERREHRKLHCLIELDIDKRIFKVKSSGKYLFNKLDHCHFIIDNGFNYIIPKRK